MSIPTMVNRLEFNSFRHLPQQHVLKYKRYGRLIIENGNLPKKNKITGVPQRVSLQQTTV